MRGTTTTADSSPFGRIFAGDEDGIPPLVRIRLWFRSLFNPALAAGARAEWHFSTLARQRRWAVERVDQSRAGISQYRAVAGRSVKRGDYICRNCGNAEIELKCKTLYGDGSYYIEYGEMMRLKEMQRITGAPIVFALMERVGSGVRPGSLRMFHLDFLLQTHDYRAGRLYDERTRCVRVPLKYTRPGFEVLRMLGGTGDA